MFSKHAGASLVLIAFAMGPLVGKAGAQTVITPSAAADNGGTMSNRQASKTIDRSGLWDADTLNTEIDDLHDSVRDNQWGASLAGRALTFTLAEPTSIDRVFLWNAIEIPSRGVKTCDFSFSTDGGSTYANTVNLEFSQGGSAAQTRTFATQTGVTHIRLDNFESWNTSWINIAEIRFGMALPVGQMQWLDWRVAVTTNAIAKDSVLLSSILGGEDADVTLYWAAGSVADPATHTGWDGSNGPLSETTGAIERLASNLAEGTAYSYALHATNSTYGTEAWTDVGTFVTLAGTIVAEYTFDGDSPASTDNHGSSTASDISLGSGIPNSLRNNRIECTGAETGGLNFAGGDYFEFTLSIPADVEITLTRITYTYEEDNSYGPAHALWSDLIGTGGGEITTPATRYARPVQKANNLYSIRTIVHDLTEAGATFSELSDTNVTFRLYIGDSAISTGAQYFDDVRLYAIGDAPVVGTVIILK